jgi:hypothetical protein
MKIATDTDILATKGCAAVILGACFFGYGRYFEATSNDRPAAIQNILHAPSQEPLSEEADKRPPQNELQVLTLPSR